MLFEGFGATAEGAYLAQNEKIFSAPGGREDFLERFPEIH